MASSLRVFVGRAWRNLNRRLSRLYISRLAAQDDTGLVRLGSEAGGWRAPVDAPAGAVAYCGGVGVDATFDFALRCECGLEVHSFDPTPKAIAYMERANKADVAFHPWGMMDEDQSIRFYAPISDSHQSWFAENLHNTDKFIDAQCFRISTIMRKLGHEALYLLKIDIEGSWYGVLDAMLADGVTPEVVNVEFDSPAPIWRVMRTTRALMRSGYAVVYQEKDNVTFRLIAAT